MFTPFGPQLIGETEKTLNALLHRFLEGTGLTEPHWVTMRLADRDAVSADSHGTDHTEQLVAAVADRAHFADAAELVASLTDRGLLDRGRPTPAGRELVAAVQATIRTRTAPIWEDLPADDVAAATRLLNEVLMRARSALR